MLGRALRDTRAPVIGVSERAQSRSAVAGKGGAMHSASVRGSSLARLRIVAPMPD